MPARRRVVTQQRARSGTNWGRSVSVVKTVVAAGTKVLLGTLVLTNPGINEVIRRSRGRFLVTSDQATAYEGTLFAWGMIVVTDLAIAAGAASIPGPLTDASDDGWFVWEPYPILAGSTDGGSSSSNSAQFRPTDFDSKAMRRVPEGFGIAIMGEVTLVGVEVTIGASVLSSRA